MAIEVRIPKEIKEYKEKIIFGLSLRQLVSVLIGAIVCLTTYFLLKSFVGTNIASDIIIVEAIPIFAFGFIKIRSFNFEEYTKIFLKHKLSANKRYYENKLEIESLKNKIELSNKKEVKKSDKGEETRRVKSIGRNEKIKRIRKAIKRAKKEFKEETKRIQTEEIDKSKERLEQAKSEYQTARKKKNKSNKKGKSEINNTKHN